MRAVIQRVSAASVEVSGEIVGEIKHGLLVLLAVGNGDSQKEMLLIAKKTVDMRIFADENGKMNKSLCEVSGGILVISQFTLYGDCKKGRRPYFIGAAPPAEAERLYEAFCARLSELGATRVEKGIFGGHMHVSLTNDGPVTIILDSEDLTI